MNPNHFTQAAVLNRGWTRTLIDQFLGEPDRTRVNMHYKSGPRVRLFDRERVERIEATPEFWAAAERAQPRREAAAKGVAIRAARTMAYAEGGPEIRVPDLDEATLIRRACDSYNWYNSDLGRDSHAAADSDPEFLRRISVNYLRHEMTDYDARLGHVAGQVGVRDAYEVIKERVLEAIADAYPWLGSECQRQLPD